jgi:hypothetical protein
MYAGLSNYPAGVTGREYEIAGADSEWTETKEVACQWEDDCPDFDKEIEIEMDLESYRGEWWGEWTCPTCNRKNDARGDMSDYERDDYDRYFDR